MSDQTTGGGTSTAASLMSSAKDVAGGALEEARAKAAEVAPRVVSAVRAEATARAEDAKEGLASGGERLAQTLRTSFGTDDNSIQGRLMMAAADSVEEFAGSLRGRSLEQLLSDAGQFARRNPGAFAVAAALAGFAVARFVRASAPSAQAYDGIEGDGYGSSYGSPRPTGTGYAGSGDSGYAGGYGAGSVGMDSGLGTGSAYAAGGMAGASAMSADTFGGTGGSAMGGSVGLDEAGGDMGGSLGGSGSLGSGSYGSQSYGSQSQSGGSESADAFGTRSFADSSEGMGSEGSMGAPGGSGSVTTSGLSTGDEDDMMDAPLDADPDALGAGADLSDDEFGSGTRSGSQSGSQGGSMP